MLPGSWTQKMNKDTVRKNTPEFPSLSVFKAFHDEGFLPVSIAGVKHQ